MITHPLEPFSTIHSILMILILPSMLIGLGKAFGDLRGWRWTAAPAIIVFVVYIDSFVAVRINLMLQMLGWNNSPIPLLCWIGGLCLFIYYTTTHGKENSNSG